MNEQEFVEPETGQTDAQASGEANRQSDGKQKKRRNVENARSKAEQAAYQPEYERPHRRSSDERTNAFNTLAWVVEGATGLVEELRHSDLGLSEKFWMHLYAMRREGLLAARAAIDSLLEQTEKESKEAQEQTQRQARRGGVVIE
jgi:hypothetical protein